VKSELTAKRVVTELRLESPLLEIMKSTNKQKLEATKLVTNVRGEIIAGK
jgi:hypothetical protein